MMNIVIPKRICYNGFTFLVRIIGLRTENFIQHHLQVAEFFPKNTLPKGMKST